MADAGDLTADARFAGAWKLISYDLHPAAGDALKPFGDAPIGRILYQANGQMSAQLMSPEITRGESGDPLDATDDEAATAWRNYVGYWGTYTVDDKAGTVTHHIEGSWFPNWIGRAQIRSFRFVEPGRLALTAESTAWRADLLWERID